MNRASLRCGLAMLMTDREVDQSEADVAFRVGLTLMPHNRWAISFPIFVLIADLFRTYSTFDIPIDDGFIGKTELMRQLAEQDIPHRLTPDAASEIFQATGQKQIGFPLFCFTVVMHNRYVQ